MNEESLFAAACQLPKGPHRDSYLQRQCAGNSVLLARLTELLAAHDLRGGILDQDEVFAATLGPGSQQPPHLDEYELLDELGRGAMGIVYRARHRSLRKFVAVKVLLGTKLDDATRQRIRVEMAALGRLNHPNLLQAFDAREIDGKPLIVTELVAGISLAALLEQTNRFSVAEACDYARQAASGLAAAHAQGLVHRDIKPANMMLEQSTETVKLLDFGLALLTHPDSKSLNGPTHPGQALGTPHFMPPEQWRDSRLVSPKSDVYALGVTLYSFLTGKPLFERSSIYDLMTAHCTAPRPQIPGLDPQLDQLLQAMLHIDPARRPNAEDVVRELDRFCIGPVPSLLPPLIETLERHGIVGRIGPEIEQIKRYLQRLPRRRVLSVFREAGTYLGRKGLVDGPERGLTALIQIFLETGDENEAFEVGSAVVNSLPESFDALHLTAAAALHSAFSFGGDPRQRLEEAVRLESAAQQLPCASQHPNLGPSLSVLAQTHHSLAKLYRSRGNESQAKASLKHALDCFHRRLAMRETALGLALYAQVLVDAGDLVSARKAADRACELDWFLREPQQLVLTLASQGIHRLEPTEEHFRRWSLVVGEWPGTPMHREYLRTYQTYLREHGLSPELAEWESDSPSGFDAASKQELARAACRVREQTLHFEAGKTLAGERPRQLQYHAKLWQFHGPQPLTVAGVPSIRVFGMGENPEAAISDLETMLFMTRERVVAAKQPQTPLIVAVKAWFSERLH